jgi:diadenosine tetraphosphatase ApaH/serine/threonine PP2A family protein phosphatase
MTATAVDQRHRQGPFDIIGDVHGCIDELRELLKLLGYRVDVAGFGERRRARISAPHGRQVVFVGDFVDRGPATPDVLRIAMAAVQSGVALAVPGNHDDKLARWIAGRPVTIAHGLDTSIAQLGQEPPPFRETARTFLEGLPSHLWLSGGALAVAHAGIRAGMLGRTDKRVRSFCLYGDTDGKTDAHGLTIRFDWTVQHEGSPAVVYGHTPIAEPAWRNGTLCLDTGCVFGGALTALRWPEMECVSVPARSTYAERKRPFGHPDPRPPTSN